MSKGFTDRLWPLLSMIWRKRDARMKGSVKPPTYLFGTPDRRFRIRNFRNYAWIERFFWVSTNWKCLASKLLGLF